MNPVRGIETKIQNLWYPYYTPSFKLMNPVRGIETLIDSTIGLIVEPFKLMNPVRGIETGLLGGWE